MDLISVNSKGGRVIRIPGFDLRTPNTVWDGTDKCNFIYNIDKYSYPYYDLKLTDMQYLPFNDCSPGTPDTIPVIPNRNYIVSALINAKIEQPGNIKMGLKMIDNSGVQVMSNLDSIPNNTNGWKRWEHEITSDLRAAHAAFQLNLIDCPFNAFMQIGDVAIVELPEKPVKTYKKGEGTSINDELTDSPDIIESADVSSTVITVNLTASRFVFNALDNTITMNQLKGTKRQLCQWTSSSSLASLRILRQDDKECIIANDSITFGIQCDGQLVVVGHDNLIMKCISNIGGKWNNLAAGNMLILDDLGGYSVNLDIPAGTGKLPRIHVGKHYDGLEYDNIKPGGVDFINKIGDTSFISKAEPGWEVYWHLSPGERLGIAVK